MEPGELRHPPLAVGVMGSASGELNTATVDAVRRLGAATARAGCTLITGACPGLPQAAVEGCLRTSRTWCTANPTPARHCVVASLMNSVGTRSSRAVESVSSYDESTVVTGCGKTTQVEIL